MARNLSIPDCQALVDSFDFTYLLPIPYSLGLQPPPQFLGVIVLGREEGMKETCYCFKGPDPEVAYITSTYIALTRI